jgi:putative ABC transport system permease protein
MRVTGLSIHDALKEGGRSGESRQGMRLRDGLVVLQFALALALLVGAGLMMQTMWNLRKVDLGFRPDHILIANVPLPQLKYDTDPAIRNFYRSVLRELQGKPGVISAAFTSDAPFTSEGDTEAYRIDGEPPLLPGQMNDALYREVTAGYLQTIGATLVEGRYLAESDTETSLPVVVVNEFLAKRHWPGQSAMGKHLRTDGGLTQPWRTVVGVVANLSERGLLLNMKPAIYLSTEQVQKPGAEFLVVRTMQDPMTTANALRASIRSIDSQQPVARMRSMEELIESNVADRKRPMILLGIFAALALVLACIGVYGVVAYSVEQRTREIGIRVAVGATPSEVTRLILAKGLRLGLIGLAAGVGLAVVLGRLLQTLLYGANSLSPVVYAVTSAALLVIAIAACIIPAQRAARVDPVMALRNE